MNRLYLVFFMALTTLTTPLTGAADYLQHKTFNTSSKEILEMLKSVTAKTINTPMTNAENIHPSLSHPYPLECLLFSHSHNLIDLTIQEYHSLIDHLLNLGANPTINNDILLITASRQDDIDLVKKLLAKRDPTNSPSLTNILFSVLKHDSDFFIPTVKTVGIIELLLQHGADINAQDLEGETILFSKYHHNPDTLHFLINHPTTNTTIQNKKAKTFDHSYFIPNDNTTHQMSQLRKVITLQKIVTQEHKNSLFGQVFIKACLNCFQGEYQTLKKAMCHPSFKKKISDLLVSHHGQITDTTIPLGVDSYQITERDVALDITDNIRTLLIPSIKEILPASEHASFDAGIKPLMPLTKYNVVETLCWYISQIKSEHVNIPITIKELGDFSLSRPVPQAPLQFLMMLKQQKSFDLPNDTYEHFIRKLLDLGANPTLPKNQSPILLAAQEGDLALFNMMLSYKPTNEPVQPDILFHLFQSRSTLSSNVFDPIVNKTKLTDDTTRIVNKLLKNGLVNVSIKDPKGLTVLSSDYQHQQLDVLQLLIQYSDINDITKAANTYRKFQDFQTNSFSKMLHRYSITPQQHRQLLPKAK
ncbi:hypothetical protein KBD08_00840 [Candidatus Babeliales bacterium]|nr:hypothetical protein [Candidatus Babeliales bacterium]